MEKKNQNDQNGKKEQLKKKLSSIKLDLDDDLLSTEQLESVEGGDCSYSCKLACSSGVV